MPRHPGLPSHAAGAGEGGEGERLLRLIIDQVPVMVAYWDAAGMLRFANRGYRAWFSPQRDPQGCSRSELFNTAGDASGERVFAEALGGQERQFTRRLVHADGRVRRVNVLYRPDRRGDAVAGVFVVLTELGPPQPGARALAPMAGPGTGANAAPRPMPASPAGATAAASTAPSPPSAFAGIPGLTMASALMFLPGRDQVYARVLRQFAEHYGAGVPGLATALQSGRRDEARRLLHSLRGACGAVGATALASCALALENLLTGPHAEAKGSPAGTAEAVQALGQTLGDLILAIEQRLLELADATALPEPAATAEAQQRLLADLAGLAALLQTGDFKAGASFRALAPALREALGEQTLRKLERPLQAYDHDSALQALLLLQARLQQGPQDGR